MKYFEDKKLEEIADILDENVNTIKSRLYRSMKKPPRTPDKLMKIEQTPGADLSFSKVPIKIPKNTLINRIGIWLITKSKTCAKLIKSTLEINDIIKADNTQINV